MEVQISHNELDENGRKFGITITDCSMLELRAIRLAIEAFSKKTFVGCDVEEAFRKGLNRAYSENPEVYEVTKRNI